MAGHEIDLAANAKPFQKGVADVQAALEEVSDALDEVTRDADRAGDKMGDALGDGAKDGARKAENAVDDISDALKDVARDADRAGRELGDEISAGAREAENSTERLEKSFKDVADASKRETGRASDAMKQEFDQGTDAAKRDLAELKDEAVANASETFSSFDGSITSLADGIQGTLGGVISNIGPAGAVAGAAAAIGVGMLTAEFERSKERAEELRQQAADLALQIIEAGGDIKNVAMADTLQQWSTELSGTSEAWDVFGDKTQTNLEAIEQGAKLASIPVEDMFKALSGRDAEAAVEVLGKLEEKLEEQRAALRNLAGARAGGTQRAEEYKTEISALEDSIKVTEERSKVTKDGAAAAKMMAEATADIAAEDEAAAAAIQARGDAIGALQGDLDSAVGAYADFADAESGALDPAGYIAGIEARTEATSNFNSNVQDLATQFGLSQEEVQAILDQGVDFAPMLQSIIDSGLGEEFVTQIQSAVGGGQEIIDGTPLGATITADSDVAGAAADLDKTAEDRGTTVEAAADTKAAGQDLDAVAKKPRTANIRAVANVSTASATLQSLVRARTAPVTVSLDLSNAERQLNEFVTRARTAFVDIKTRGGKEVP